MSSKPSVIVVGAGIVGLCTAWFLQRSGADVTVLDRDGPGEGTSSGNAGAISAGSVAPLAMPGVLKQVPGMLLDPKGALHIPPGHWPAALPWLWRFVLSAKPERVREIANALASLLSGAEERHREILREEAAEDLLVERGQLYLYRDAEHLAKDGAAWSLRRAHGLVTEELDCAGIEALEPEVSPAYQRGLLLPQQGHIANPRRHAQVVARGVERLGGRVERAEVRALLVEEGRVAGVVTERGERRAERTVLAAGAFSARLLAPLGIKVPLESQRGYHVMLPDPGVMPRRPVVPADRKAFLTPMEEGLRVAGTVEFGGLDRAPNEERARLLLGDLKNVYPQARTEGAKPFWMGHRPCLPDSLPVLGELARLRGLWCAFGHGHLGLTGAAPTGALLAAHMLGPKPNTTLAPFALERFAS